MRSYLWYIVTIILSFTLLSSCSKDEEYVYPDLYNEFVDFTTNGEGTVYMMTTDAGENWNLPTIKGLTGLKPDSIYRVVAKFVPGSSENDNMATLYSSQGTLSPVPVSASRFTVVKTDPVKIQSIWRGGEYVNIVLNVLVKDKSHKFNFIQNSLSDTGEGGKKRLSITLYHDNNDDVLAFYRTVYLSVPLWAYKERLNKGDEVEININTYDKGVVKTILNY